MALEGCAACVKYIMIVWNFIILVMGIAITGVGIWMVVDKDSGKYVDDLVGDESPFIINYSQASDQGMYDVIAYILIAFGAITVIIAFLGYCGAMKESKCLLGTCFALLFIIFCTLVGLGVYLYIEKDEVDVDQEKLHPMVEDMLKDATKKYSQDEASKEFMIAVHQKFSCCGWDLGALDFATSFSSPPGCITYATTPCTDPYYEYVRSKIGVKQFFGDRMTIAMAVALGVAGALILAMILTLVLLCSIRRSGSY